MSLQIDSSENMWFKTDGVKNFSDKKLREKLVILKNFLSSSWRLVFSERFKICSNWKRENHSEQKKISQKDFFFWKKEFFKENNAFYKKNVFEKKQMFFKKKRIFFSKKLTHDPFDSCENSQTLAVNDQMAFRLFQTGKYLRKFTKMLKKLNQIYWKIEEKRRKKIIYIFLWIFFIRKKTFFCIKKTSKK